MSEPRSRLVRSSRGFVTAVEAYGQWFNVKIDPDLPERGIVKYDDETPCIWLREWASEVFLHELIHVAFRTHPANPSEAWWLARHFYTAEKTRVTDDEEETFVQHLSHLLDDIGYRLEAPHE